MTLPRWFDPRTAVLLSATAASAPDDEEVDEVCDQITNRLLDVSGRHVNTVIANAPMES